MQWIACAPKIERAASSSIAAQATIGSPMPPYSLGACGAHRPAFLAFSRTGASRSGGMFSCSVKLAVSDSSGSTCSSTKARTRRRMSSISGESVKSISVPLSPDRNDLPAVDHDGGAGDVAAGVRRQQQQCAVKLAVLAEAAGRDFALDGGAGLAHQVIVVHFGDEPAGGDGIDAHALE